MDGHGEHGSDARNGDRDAYSAHRTPPCLYGFHTFYVDRIRAACHPVCAGAVSARECELLMRGGLFRRML
jgi:hypothetical protein